MEHVFTVSLFSWYLSPAFMYFHWAVLDGLHSNIKRSCTCIQLFSLAHYSWLTGFHCQWMQQPIGELKGHCIPYTSHRNFVVIQVGHRLEILIESWYKPICNSAANLQNPKVLLRPWYCLWVISWQMSKNTMNATKCPLTTSHGVILYISVPFVRHILDSLCQETMS